MVRNDTSPFLQPQNTSTLTIEPRANGLMCICNCHSYRTGLYEASPTHNNYPPILGRLMQFNSTYFSIFKNATYFSFFKNPTNFWFNKKKITTTTTSASTSTTSRPAVKSNYTKKQIFVL